MSVVQRSEDNSAFCVLHSALKIKNALVGMLADAKLKTPTTGLYTRGKRPSTLLFCEV